ncbi:MAG TPA: hypothetical protein VLI90_00775, partial [Tepidisphaeraceae bacterium]|nr:hypothetical protein [Tepidisphaeraceae bacterium]
KDGLPGLMLNPFGQWWLTTRELAANSRAPLLMRHLRGARWTYVYLYISMGRCVAEIKQQKDLMSEQAAKSAKNATPIPRSCILAVFCGH